MIARCLPDPIPEKEALPGDSSLTGRLSGIESVRGPRACVQGSVGGSTVAWGFVGMSASSSASSVKGELTTVTNFDVDSFERLRQ